MHDSVRLHVDPPSSLPPPSLLSNTIQGLYPEYRVPDAIIDKVLVAMIWHPPGQGSFALIHGLLVPNGRDGREREGRGRGAGMMRVEIAQLKKCRALDEMTMLTDVQVRGSFVDPRELPLFFFFQSSIV